MAAKLGADPDQLVGELVRAIAQDLANGKSPQAVTEGLTKGGLSREQAAKLVDVVVEARRKHENSAEGRAQKRSHGVSRMLQGALWGGGGVVVTLLSMGSGGGRVFFGAVIFGAYLFISGLVLWGGNTAQIGDEEELKGGPGWLREVRIGDKVKDPPIVAPAASAPPPVPAARPGPTSAAPRTLPRPATTAPTMPRRLALISEGTSITRLYVIAFLWDQVFGLALPFNVFGRIGLGRLVGPLSVLSIMTFVAGVLCAVHVLLDKLEYKFLVLPAYHVVGVLLMYQLMNPVLVEKLSIAHSAVGLIGGLAWLSHTRPFRKPAKPRRNAAGRSRANRRLFVVALGLAAGLSGCAGDSTWSAAWEASTRLAPCLQQYERANGHYPDALSDLRSVAIARQDGCAVADMRLLAEGRASYVGFDWNYWALPGRKNFVLAISSEPQAPVRCFIRLDQTFILRRTCEQWWGSSMGDLDLREGGS